ncbi:glutamine synthetase [bacterium SM23_57]|nr:MAG: glutamine synthetase [bacterium SM23_57]
MTKDEVLRTVEKNDIDIIRLWFPDILGHMKGFAIPRTELDGAMDHGMGFDGSSIEGFARIHESDLMAVPDPNTFVLMPEQLDSSRAAAMFCDLLTTDGKPYAGDPRGVLKRNLAKIAEQGMVFNVGPEIEFFYFKSSETPEILDHSGYFDSSIIDTGAHLRKQSIAMLGNMGIQCEFSHHEVAPSQHEIDLKYNDALRMADLVMTYRLVIKEIARKNGVFASFMPKPLFGHNGSGMHTHQSIFRDGKNLFFSPEDTYHLSDFAKHYVAGILKHVREITSILNQSVNSYKRLVIGYEAPVYISWGQKNRSALVRVPRYRQGHEKATRVELRSPDPVTNPYLAFSVMLAAGMKGVEEKYPLPDPVEENIYEMSSIARVNMNMEMLPGNLYEAILETEKSELVQKALGDHLFNKFIDNKKIEWDQYQVQVTDYELEKYYPIS